MTEFVGAAFLIRLAYALLAAAIVHLLLRWYDRRAGIDFKEFANDCKSDPRALAHYLGLRILAVCVLVGFVLS